MSTTETPPRRDIGMDITRDNLGREICQAGDDAGVSAPERTLAEELAARDRQACQAAGLRALARLVESDRDVSAILAGALSHMAAHLGDADHIGDVNYFARSAVGFGAVHDTSWPSSAGFVDAHLYWSEHVSVRVQCCAPLPAPSPGMLEQAQ